MKKIGIITHYYNSENYGGVLQSYALCKYLLDDGYLAEQICYDKNRGLKLIDSVKRILHIIKRELLNILNYNEYNKLKVRKNKFKIMRNNMIPHSRLVYNYKNLKKVTSEYDIFITGSDQIWHPNAVCDAYLLDFGVKNVVKMSYAASVAKDGLSSEEMKRYKTALVDYKAISVREKDAVNIIQPLTELKVEWVLDPVFLKSKTEWENLAISRKIKNKYIFCYFLGDSISHRRLAREYAEKKGLKIVTLPFLTNKYRECDADFGDYRLYDVSPFEFVGLIKDAEYVFTDSFHAVAFSTILEKEFVVFERNAKNSMGSRIRSITDLAGVSARYCYNQERCNLDYILELAKINYAKNKKELDAMISRSKDFLLTNLGDKG